MKPGSNAPNEVVQTQFELRGSVGYFELYRRAPRLSSHNLDR
jgi:hypothetical protein